MFGTVLRTNGRLEVSVGWSLTVATSSDGGVRKIKSRLLQSDYSHRDAISRALSPQWHNPTIYFTHKPLQLKQICCCVRQQIQSQTFLPLFSQTQKR